MISVRNLTKRYGDLVAVDDVTFTVERGEVLGFLGPNGAGKTTTMRMITGYLVPTSGTVEVDGYDVVESPLEARTRIGYLPENPPLYGEMTVYDYLDFVADIRGVPRAVKSRRIDEAMEWCGIGNVRGRLIGHLSKGFKQRIGIAQALVHEPSLLILDEPTQGLDPKQIIEIRQLIKQLTGERTVILSTHILHEVQMTCSRVVIINEGKVVLTESLDSLGGGGRFVVRARGGRGDAASVIRGVAGVSGVEQEGGDGWSVEADGDDVRARVAKALVSAGWDVYELRPVTMTLEDVFLKAISMDRGASQIQ